MKKISASIVIYNTQPDELERAISSFLSSSMSGDLFIVDNSPSPAAEALCRKYACQYIFTGNNLGYGRAHNLVMRQVIENSPYHLVLNPDVYFQSHVLEQLYWFMENHHNAGLVMPKVLYPGGAVQRLCKLLPTPLNLASRRFLPAGKGILKKLNDYYEMTFSSYNRVMSVPFLSGCFMFMRSSSLKETGLFDERFFLYAEDTDLSRRIHQKFDTLFYPHVEIYHTHARGSYKDLRLMWCNLLSAIQYFNKWGWIFDAERREINKAAAHEFLANKKFEPLELAENRFAQRSMNE